MLAHISEFFGIFTLYANYTFAQICSSNIALN